MSLPIKALDDPHGPPVPQTGVFQVVAHADPYGVPRVSVEIRLIGRIDLESPCDPETIPSWLRTGTLVPPGSVRKIT